MAKLGRKDKKRFKKNQAKREGGISGLKTRARGTDNKVLRKIRNWL